MQQTIIRLKNFLLLLLKSFTLNLLQFHIMYLTVVVRVKSLLGKKRSVQVAECTLLE